jgi:hypothetical protein
LAAAQSTLDGKTLDFAKIWDDARLEADMTTTQSRGRKEQKLEHANKNVDKNMEGEAVEKN